MKKGTKVRFLGGPYGVVASLESGVFESEIVGEGDEGTYFGPHPTVSSWQMIAVNLGGRDFFVPLPEGRFEEVE